MQRKKLFKENIHDIETLLEALSIASDCEKDLFFIDSFIQEMRKNSDADLVEISFKILSELDLMRGKKNGKEIIG